MLSILKILAILLILKILAILPKLKILAMPTIDDPLGSGACLSTLPWQLDQLEGGTIP